MPKITRRGTAAASILDKLLASDNPSIVWKTRRQVLGEPDDASGMRALRRSIRNSQFTKKLLSRRRKDGTIGDAPYRKWQGPHWTLTSLVEIGYPPGDRSLASAREQVYDWLLDPKHLEFPRSASFPGQPERFRHCASIEGNAIWYSLLLGLADERTEELAARLRKWQWPDGGWNCDKREAARISSVQETLIPMRALALHAALTGNRNSRAASDRAAEFLLERNLLWRKRDSKPMKPAFLQIEYPHRIFDLLAALVMTADAGRIRDPRCARALDLLESKRLPDGGFPLERCTFIPAKAITTRGEFVDWGPCGKRRSNPWATIEALYVLRMAGR